MKRVLISGGAGIKRGNDGKFKRTRKIWKFKRWDDGYVRIKKNGYKAFWVYRPDYAKFLSFSYASGYVRRTHVVWWLKTGKVVPKGYVVHHKDRDSLNDRFSNLELMKSGKHTRLHSKKKKIKCVCQYCSTEFKLPQWRINQGRGKYCSLDCFYKNGKNE